MFPLLWFLKQCSSNFFLCNRHKWFSVNKNFQAWNSSSEQLRNNSHCEVWGFKHSPSPHPDHLKRSGFYLWTSSSAHKALFLLGTIIFSPQEEYSCFLKRGEECRLPTSGSLASPWELAYFSPRATPSTAAASAPGEERGKEVQQVALLARRSQAQLYNGWWFSSYDSDNIQFTKDTAGEGQAGEQTAAAWEDSGRKCTLLTTSISSSKHTLEVM